jgi:hypothetical protein
MQESSLVEFINESLSFLRPGISVSSRGAIRSQVLDRLVPNEFQDFDQIHCDVFLLYFDVSAELSDRFINLIFTQEIFLVFVKVQRLEPDQKVHVIDVPILIKLMTQDLVISG